jgi:hypothetical protein
VSRYRLEPTAQQEICLLPAACCIAQMHGSRGTWRCGSAGCGGRAARLCHVTWRSPGSGRRRGCCAVRLELGSGARTRRWRGGARTLSAPIRRRSAAWTVRFATSPSPGKFSGRGSGSGSRSSRSGAGPIRDSVRPCGCSATKPPGTAAGSASSARPARWFPASKTCSGCGAVKARLPLSERIYACTACGLVLDRDVNAAVNLLQLAASGAEGRNACGAAVRPGLAGLAALNQEPGPALAGKTGTASRQREAVA